ncbi:SMC family ATPase [Candidatus Woesearchaeota archaeon]|nr:SMC family ATPase [Candidatus Woesearchaeota archaeon]
MKSELTPIELKSKVFELLQYPRELVSKSRDLIYRYTVYTPQEEMKQILQEDKDTRLDTLRKVFGIDKYKRVRENSSILVRYLRELNAQYSGEVFDLDEKIRQKAEFEQQKTILNEKLSLLEPILSALKSRIEQKKSFLQQLEQKLTELTLLRKNHAIIDTKINEKFLQQRNTLNEINLQDKSITLLEQKLKSIDSELTTVEIAHYQQYLGKIKELEQDLQQKELSYQEVSNKHTRSKIESASLNARMQAIKERHLLLENKLKILPEKQAKFEELRRLLASKDEFAQKIIGQEKLLNEMNVQIKEFEVNKANSEKLKLQISQLNNCPVCQQEVSETHKHDVVTEEESKIVNLINELSAVMEEREKLQNELANNKRHLESMQKQEMQLQSITSEINALTELAAEKNANTELLNALNAKINLLNSNILQDKELLKHKEEIDSLRLLIKKIHDYALRENEKNNLLALINDKKSARLSSENTKHAIEAELRRLADEKKIAEEKLALNSEAEQQFNSEKVALEQHYSQERMQELTVIALRKETESIEKSILLLTNEIERKNNVKQKISKMNELNNWLQEYFITLTEIMERHVMLKLYHEFNELFLRWFDILIEDETMSTRLDDEFTPIIEQNGYEISFDNLSGGERTACALAYRLALNKTINDVMSRIKTRDLIILDEPTDGFSNEQLDKVRDVLEQLNMKQVIIVSHESKVESFVNSVVRIEKREHVSCVV